MRIFVFFLFVIHTFSNLDAQILKPVKWHTDYKAINNEEFELIFTATMDSGWSIYSQYLESDDGPVRTSFEFDSGAYELVGKNEESGNRKEGHDPLFDMNVIKFSKKAVFVQKVKVNDLSKPITGYLEFMTCDDTKCLPPDQVDFEFKLKAPVKTGGVETPSKQEVEKIAGQPTKKETQQKEEMSANKPDEKPLEAKTTAKKDEEIIVSKIPETIEVPENPSAKTTLNDSDDDGLGNGNILDPVSWSFSGNKIGENEYNLVFVATIEKGWTIYSQYLESDDGPEPTSFNFDEKGDADFVDKTKEEGPDRIEGHDKFFDMNVVKYKNEAIFTQLIKTSNPEKPIYGYLEFMTCDDTKCLPPTAIDFWVEPASLTTLIGDAAYDRIKNAKTVDQKGWNAQNGMVDQVIPSIRSTYEEPVGDCGKEEIAKNENVIWTFILGFLGGLLALLTPCVFPMIPLTVSYFTKGSKTRTEGIKNGLIYGVSIIVIYVAIGLLITGVFGATALNELSTNWVANTLFFAIFIFFAFSFFGYYEITLPSSWANKSDSMADRGGLIGIFFMAFTLAIVSFSCTGPIIGSAIVQSATSSVGPFIVMLGFSTALALPFGLFAAFPAWLNSLPSSGSWMTSVKVVLGFLELALALKFLSVADMTMHWGILGYELFMGLWVLIFGAMTLYLFGFIRFPHDSPLKKLSPARWSFALLSLALTVYLASGFMINEKTKSYNSLTLMSGLAPPTLYNYFLPAPAPNVSIKEKYGSFSKCANNLDCFKDYYEGLEYARETNKPILLDFTGHGCVNCRKTEEQIWIVDNVWNKINNDFVLISLYVDDRKKLDEIVTSIHTNKKIRNVGNKWADFQIVNFEQNSQPLYVMMTPDEKVLAKPRGYKSDVEDYAEFLNCGLQTFKGTTNRTGMN